MKVALSPRPCLKHAAELDCGHGQPSKKIVGCWEEVGAGTSIVIRVRRLCKIVVEPANDQKFGYCTPPHPSQKYARQIGSFPHFFCEHTKIVETTT